MPGLGTVESHIQRNQVEENRQQDSQDSWSVPEKLEAEETPLIETNQDIKELSGPTAAEKVPTAYASKAPVDGWWRETGFSNQNPCLKSQPAKARKVKEQ